MRKWKLDESLLGAPYEARVSGSGHVLVACGIGNCLAAVDRFSSNQILSKVAPEYSAENGAFG